MFFGKKLIDMLRGTCRMTLLLALYVSLSKKLVIAKSAQIVGDLILGGLFPVHEKGTGDSPCGTIWEERGIQRMEAMMYSIDKINKDPSILPGIKLGAEILDTCARDTYALNQSLEFVRASFNNLDSSEFYCSDGTEPKAKSEQKAVAGVIGGSGSDVSIHVANLLRLFKIPQISYASTSAALSDKSRFDFFARTVPPDTFQAKAMADIVQLMNWTYVSTVASEGDYGQSGIDSFAYEARARNICIATSEKIGTHSNDETFDNVIKNLRKKPNAKAVIMFARAEDSRGMMEAIMRMNATGEFTWIASDGWGNQESVSDGRFEAAEGAITINPKSNHITEFDHYLHSLTPKNNQRNPWFREYWMSKFSCGFFESRREAKKSAVPECKSDVPLLTASNIKQEHKIQFVVDAVYAMAFALHNMHQDLCPGRKFLCNKMKKIDGSRLYNEYILSVSFIDQTDGRLVKFNPQGDGIGRYDIMNFQRVNDVTGEYKYVTVGQWKDGLHLNLVEQNVTFGGGRTEPPFSQCSLPCGPGEVKKMQQGETCCWFCQKCADYEFMLDEYNCEDCGPGQWPYPDKKSCYYLEMQYMEWHTVYAIVPIVISILGILLTMSVIVIFILFNDTPIVMASGRELSYMLLSGILICYLMTFILLGKPSVPICGLQRFGVGFGFCTMYAALLTKTNRISRIFDSASKSAKRPGYISPRSQVIIALVLVSVQVVGTVVWLIIEPPSTRPFYPEGRRKDVILKCNIEDSSFLISLVYVMLLIITCTVYAVKTRKIPENFNESKFIGFTMYTTCIVWLAFVPIYFGTLNAFQVQITTLCVSISLSASVALLCLFSPKIYIILFQPDKNVRKLTMNSAQYKKAPATMTTSYCTSAVNHGIPAEQIKLNVTESPLPGLRNSQQLAQVSNDSDSMASL